MSINVSGSATAGPVRVDRDLFEDFPEGRTSQIRTEHKVWVEEFDTQFADGLLAGAGATVTDVNTPAANTETVTGATPYLLLDAGTTVDSGVGVQFNVAPSQATYTNPALRSAGPITSTTTLMLGRELRWYSKMGFRSNSAAWDGKALFGWFCSDTSLLAPTTGEPSVALGCGIGFHIGETGIISAVCQQAASTTAGTFTPTGLVLGSSGLPLTTDIFRWMSFGFSARWGATTGVVAHPGVVDYYFNDSKILTLVRTGAAAPAIGMPMSSTQVYSVTYSILNGPVGLQDMGVSSVITGISRPTT